MSRRLVCFAVFLASQAQAEMLPSYGIDFVCLRAWLIIEARLVEPGVVEVLRVHHGDAKAGDRLALRRFEDLPRRAFGDWVAAMRDAKQGGTPVEGGTTVLFLRPAAEGGYEPVGWGSGVKWVVGNRVYGHVQMMNPGPYLLLPDREADTPEAFQKRMSEELERRRKFEACLVLLDPEERVRALLPYVVATSPGAYGSAAREAILQTGERACRVVLKAAEGAQDAAQRFVLAELAGRTGSEAAVPLLANLLRELTPRVQKIADTRARDLSRDDGEALERWRTLVFRLAACAGPTQGASAELRDALRWGAQHGDREIMEHAARGLARLPETEGVELLGSVLREGASGAGEGDEGQEDRRLRQNLVDSLADHRIPASVPVLVDLLDDRDPRVAQRARSGLARIAGKDLGKSREPWLEWLAGLAAPRK